MFKWIPRVMIITLILCGVGLFAAHAFGTFIKNDVLVIGANNIGLNETPNVRFYDLQTGLDLQYNFPLENLHTALNWNTQNREFFLIAEDEEVYRDGTRVLYRERHHNVAIFDLDTGESWPLLDYSFALRRRRGPGPTTYYSYNFYNNLYPFYRSDLGLLMLYDSAVDKLFVFDMEDGYYYRNTIPVDIETPNNVWPPSLIALSPDGQQIAAYHRPGVLMLVNIDGTDLRYFNSPSKQEFQPLWSQNSRYLLLADQGNGGHDFMAILDVESGEWLPQFLDIPARAPQWICKGDWIAYETYDQFLEPTGQQMHLLHMESERIIHLSDHPVLGDYEIGNLWTPDCAHLVIITGSDAYSTSSSGPLFLANMDFSNLRLIHNNALRFFFTIEEDHFIYWVREEDGTTTIFRERFDGVGEPERLGIVPAGIDYINTYLDRYERGLYVDYGTSYNSSRIYLVDMQTGEKSVIMDGMNTVGGISLLYPES